MNDVLIMVLGFVIRQVSLKPREWIRAVRCGVGLELIERIRAAGVVLTSYGNTK